MRDMAETERDKNPYELDEDLIRPQRIYANEQFSTKSALKKAMKSIDQAINKSVQGSSFTHSVGQNRLTGTQTISKDRYSTQSHAKLSIKK